MKSTNGKNEREVEVVLDSENGLRVIFENVLDGLLVVDVKTKKFLIGNRRLCKMLGYSSEEINRIGIMDIHPKKDLPFVLEQFEKQAKKKIEIAENIPVKRKDGSVFYADINSTPIIFEGKLALLGVFRDVTKHKQAADALRESEERFRRIFDEGPIGMIITGLDFCFLKVNPALCHMLGYTEQELTKLSFPDITHPEDVKKDIENASKLIKGEIDEYRTQKRYIKKNKEVIWIDLTATVVKDEGGKPDYFLTIAEDISERKKAEEDLIESEAQFKILAEESPNMIFINKRGRVVYVNKKSEETMGYSRDEFYSKDFNFMDLIAPEFRDLVQENFRKHSAGDEIRPYEYNLLTKDGREIFAIHTTKLIEYEGEQAILGIVTDITERKKSELAMRKRLMKFRLENGNTYLVKERDPSLSVETIKDLVSVGYKGIIISRDPMAKKTAYGTGVEFIWLTEQPEESALPDGLKGLEERINTLPNNSFALIERLDYLISKYGFDKILSFIHRIRELAFLRQSIFVLSIDPATLKKEMLRQIEKECKDVERMFEKLHEDLHEILKTIYSQENVGIKLSYSGLGNLLGKSKPTVRKNIKQLIYLGYVVEEKQGKMKIIELTEKGRGLFV
jgi:PAS domain S-box-containing protein